jgi:chemotaxis protein MotB
MGPYTKEFPMRFWLTTSALVLASLVSTGCSSNNSVAVNRKLSSENQALRLQVDELNTQLHSTNAAIAERDEAIAQRDARLAQFEASLNTPATPTDSNIGGVTATYDAKTRTLTVNLPDEVLFTPGSAEIRKTAYPTLDKIVAALKSEYAGKNVRVKGHTDNDPIVRSKHQFKDNLDLSLERAASVTRYLASKGVTNGNVETVGVGASAPKDSSNKAVNRRVEISVILE